MADALSKRDPLAPTIPLTLKGREFELAFNFNTFGLFEAGMEELCGRLPPDGEAYNFLEAFSGMMSMHEYLQSISSSRHLQAVAEARDAGRSEEEIDAMKPVGASYQDVMRSLRFVSMRKVHAALWACVSEGGRARARQTGSKWIPVSIHDLGQLLDHTNIMDALKAIMQGQTANSPRPGEIEEAASNGDRPLPQIVIDPGEPMPGPSLVPEPGSA